MMQRLDAEDPSRPFRSAAVLFVSLFTLLAFAGPRAAEAQDRQRTPLGQGGSTTAFCILPGPDGDIDSPTVPDDQTATNGITVGDDGICDSSLAGDDVYSNNGVVTGGGLPHARVISAGSGNICDDNVTPGGDDVRLVAVGKGIPHTVAIRAGVNGTIESTAVGDDVVTAAICFGSDGTLQSTPNAADVVADATNRLCDLLCLFNEACIIPGPDDVLQTAVDPSDTRVNYITTGPDGIAQSAKIGDDLQAIPVGQGAEQQTGVDATCIDSGDNGIAETSVCGNGIHDVDENASGTAGANECDDGDTTSGDGCANDCTIEVGWACSGTPSVCTPICGDGIMVGGEACDDGNASNADACLNVTGICTVATCGDGVRKTSGPGPNELCDDGNLVNGDGCDANCTVSGCGNGVLNAGELCDDNNLVNGDGCDANCTPTGCGNGVITGTEQCDDGNASNLDACLNTCVPNVCSDGFVLTGTEQCDDGNLTSGDGCDINCTTTGCGNGITTSGEQCDDGNANNGDSCLTTCALAACGDGFRKTTGLGPNEQCDDGNGVNGDGCDVNCTTSRCGNGVVGAPETCDDANSANGDGCDNNCTLTACGNGIKTSGEACDDGNGSNQDNCTNACANASCGDGFIKTSGTPPLETCDDSNVVSGDGCDANCTVTACGNGIVTAGETCDDGNPTNGDGCDVNCTPTGCNNGIISPGEDCEDGNLVDGDGCDSNCTTTGCGNGIATAGEECDDGNTRNDDDCVVGCRNARCGDGFKERSVEECDDGCLAGIPNVCEPGIDDGDNGCSATCTRTRSPRCGNGTIEAPEACDDGNSSDNDDCTNSCAVAICGDGVLHDRGTGVEECDDGNAAAGDGCSVTCTKECGNGVLDYFCSDPESSAGQPCASDAACDSSFGAGDGLCITGETCDPGAAGLCVDDTINPVCSNFCVTETCGNGLVECAEECDLGADNAVPGSGCTTSCTRNLAEAPNRKECPAAFTVDLPPQPLPAQRETCRDGASCDFDQSVNGQCAFRIGVCLNLSQPGCTPDGLRTFDLLGVKIRGTCSAGHVGARCVVGEDCDTSVGAGDGTCLRDRAVVATTTLTDAVAALATAGASSVPGRCREGLKGKVCSTNNECDRAFGLGNGRCDIGTGVEFAPALDGADQLATCTPGEDIVVDAGSKLKLRSFVRRDDGAPDRDRLLLVCEP